MGDSETQLLNWDIARKYLYPEELSTSLLLITWIIRFTLGAISLVVGFTMLVSKKFRMHPYRLRALEMMFLTAYVLDLYRILLEFNWEQMFNILI